MSSRRLPTALSGALVAALVGAACSSRAVPTAWPPGSAASTASREVPVAPGPLALTADPPLPGDDATGWDGLADDAGAPAEAPPDAPAAPQHPAHETHHGGPRVR